MYLPHHYSVHYHSITKCTLPQQYTVYTTTAVHTAHHYSVHHHSSTECTLPRHYSVHHHSVHYIITVYITTALHSVHYHSMRVPVCVCACVRVCVSACMHTDQCHVCINGLNSLSLLFGASYFLIAFARLCSICV